MMFKNNDAGSIVLDLIDIIQDNKDYLSEIDGKIGDGDHGVNMNKGFTMCQAKLDGKEYSFSEGLEILSLTLMEDIGGSMGPLYGVFFDEMSMMCQDEVDKSVFETMLKSAIQGIQDIGNAKLGDKTMLDTLIPGLEAYSRALADGKDFSAALDNLKAGAKAGWKSTKDMVAKVGRASRLGERSRGVLDAGATSCYLILCTMADSTKKLLL